MPPFWWSSRRSWFGQGRDWIRVGEEAHYLAATQSRLHDADLRVANNYAQGEYLAYLPGRLEPHFLKRAASGEIYSIHAPGVSVIVLPAFALAGYRGAVATMILIAALTVAMTWRIAYRLSGSSAGAWASVIGVFFTAPYFFHTFTIYPEVIGSFCVVCGIWLLIELADPSFVASAKGEGGDVSTRAVIAVGVALAMLPWLHSRFAVLAAILGLLIVVRLAARPAAPLRIAAFLAVPVIAGIAWFAFFYLIWGSPSPAAPYGPDTGTSASYILRGLIGLLFDQQFGLITTAPIYLLALAGGIVLFRQRPRLAIELLLIAVPYAMTAASFAMWWAGSAAPARFLVAVLPLAAIPIAVGWKEHRTATPMLLLLFSVAMIVPRAFVESGRLIFNSRGGVDGALLWLSPIVDLTSAVPSVHRDGGTQAIRDAAVWIILFVGAATLASLAAKRSKAMDWTVSAFALAAATMTALAMVSGFHHVSLLTPERSKLAAFGAFRPSWQTQTIDLWKTMSSTEFANAMMIPIRSTRINRVPAGEYDVTTAFPETRVAMRVGRNDAPFAQLAGGGDQMPLRLRLPVSLQSLNFEITGEVPEDAPALHLRPVSVIPAPERRFATHGARYGAARAFFFDEWAYPERDGFWTRANGSVTVVIDTDEGTRLSGLPISITGGAVPTTLRLSVGNLDESFAGGGQKQDVLPPAEGGSWRLRLRSGAGFRPSERDPAPDVRELAAWIAVH